MQEFGLQMHVLRPLVEQLRHLAQLDNLRATLHRLTMRKIRPRGHFGSLTLCRAQMSLQPAEVLFSPAYRRTITLSGNVLGVSISCGLSRLGMYGLPQTLTTTVWPRNEDT